MNNQPAHLIVSLAVAATTTACITVNIYFPAPEVRRAAEEIVEETWGGTSTGSPPRPDTAEENESSWFEGLVASPAYAQEADINVSTAAIRALKESMKARSEGLKPFLRAGHVGIGHDGLLVVRDLAGVPLRNQAAVRRLVKAENRDRKSLYVEIAKANNFGNERVADIEAIFAETWIDKAEKGWWVQKTDQSWVQR
jgi:uncharacterized protein YdbL (DUF1318 family)